ncbi:precorrin-6y C5,15-methyltransferase (decarboxylating) subunit CbiE [Kosakonia radicincitans]|uniref:precorrin-6y C5,15-methyltransferase (decarboxylating) subunit CbiE n=1 Tax=Kosakonia radicincitans TaxID=283686 RepID=UPI000460B2F0|nr:precorrin-6y C5,15-methyltransferase (decarboxylating) subunit CbiE [Kosakonia radicincitans]KDE34821.1 cobalt-precorrin-6Y C(5)-methyltransferase [Kosakonia radicincitans UMEnt01/12]QEM90913.1 precorrin-6y C5,15-methyltransferase (decarboxylating) subunit CbiE [Kosakonia radicincitans]VVT52424.1 Cobalt-precorrin-7 (C5)-methyltransferase (EC [Kosakonia radicincitans]
MLTIAGMGPGNLALMTPQALEAVAQADVLVGGKRHLAQFADFRGDVRLLDADIPGLLAWLEQQQQRRVVVLASGDPLFYGIGTRLVAHFGIGQLRIIPGISAVQYLCARTGIDMNDIWLTSSHGRAVDFDALARAHKVAMVTDAKCGPKAIAEALLARGAEKCWLVIGENLGLDDERIHRLRPAEVQAEYAMNVVVILNER